MRTLNPRERILVMLVAVAVAGVAIDWWRATERRRAWVEEAERALLVHGPVVDPASPETSSIREILPALVRDGATIVEGPGRISVSWRASGATTWSRLEAISRAPDVVLASLSLRKANGALEAALVLEMRRAP